MEEKLWSGLVISGMSAPSGGVGAHVKSSLYSNHIPLSSTLSEVVCRRGRKHLSSTSPQTLVRLILLDRPCLGCHTYLQDSFAALPATCLPFWICHHTPLLPQLLAAGPGSVLQGASLQESCGLT